MQLRGDTTKRQFEEALDDLGTVLDGSDGDLGYKGYIDQLNDDPKRVARRLAALAKEMRDAERRQLG